MLRYVDFVLIPKRYGHRGAGDKGTIGILNCRLRCESKCELLPLWQPDPHVSIRDDRELLAIHGVNDTNKTKCPALFPGRRWHIGPGGRLRCNRVAAAHANQQRCYRASSPKHKAPPGYGQVCVLVLCAMPMTFHSRSSSHKRQALTEPEPHSELREAITTLGPEIHCPWRRIGIVKHVALGVDP